MHHTGSWPAGTPCWIDITATDLKRSQEFYRRVFGWTYTDPVAEYGDYCNALVDGRPVAGMAPPMPGMDPVPSVWTVYLATDDLDATHEKALQGGASQVAAPMDLSPLGRMALWADPAGILVGAWESGTHTGFEATDEPGAPAWIDLTTPDDERARAFYADLFGYVYDEMPSGGDIGYAMFRVPGGDRPAGGIGRHDPDGVWPPGWNVAIAVADVDASLPAVREAGGTVVEEPSDFEFGRMATVRGPDGELFTLFAGAPM